MTDTNGRGSNDFRETLSASIPNRTYRSRIEAPIQPGIAEIIIRMATVIICTLLVVRFVIELFTTSRANEAVRATFRATDWAVAPFQAIIGHVPAQSVTMGTFDWSALAAIVAAIIVSALLIALIRPRIRYN